jgi:hypothetical protein
MSGSATKKKAPARLTSAAHRNRDRGQQQEIPSEPAGDFLAHPFSEPNISILYSAPPPNPYRKYPRANSVPFVIISAVRPKFRPWY